MARFHGDDPIVLVIIVQQRYIILAVIVGCPELMTHFTLPGTFSDNPWNTLSEDLTQTAHHSALGDVQTTQEASLFVPSDPPPDCEYMNTDIEPSASIYTTGVVASFNSDLTNDPPASRQDLDLEMEPELTLVLQRRKNDEIEDGGVSY